MPLLIIRVLLKLKPNERVLDPYDVNLLRSELPTTDDSYQQTNIFEFNSMVGDKYQKRKSICLVRRSQDS